ncbi:MAG: tetratricopeptide repeat protein [Sulfuritalea sp.]|nr:tetratricopeptide repeat protein [Sulfuritalea sp.]
MQAALALHQQGKFDQAEALYREILKSQPRHFDALQLLATIAAQRKNSAAAVELFDQALKINPDHANSLNNRGVALRGLERHEDALKSYERAIKIKPDYAEAHYNRGIALRTLNRHAEALESYESALKLKPDYAEALNNRGAALRALNRHEDALESYDRALKIRPDHAESHYNRGTALLALKRPEEALESYHRALKLKPDNAEALNNRGNALRDLKRPDEALESYDRALGIKPDHAEALNNRGNALRDLKRLEEALASYDRALKVKPDYAEALYNRGNALRDLKRPEEALESYDRVLRLKPELEFLCGDWLYTKMKVSDWSDLESQSRQLFAKIECDEKAAAPFSVLAISDSRALQRKVAETWVRAKYPRSNALPKIAKRTIHNKIRIGYFSADLHNHATANLMAELFETHDKSKFELTAFSFGPEKSDVMRKRVAAAFDRFIDVRTRSDRDVAILARSLEIDIAVDLKGFTQDSRTGVFAMRAAPLQVNYLGYPGTMGADYIDYLIADPTLIPESHQAAYAEKIAYLPNCYQVNDAKRRIAEKEFSRVELGLPRRGFVFCCFNNNYKITPDTFDRWMRILKRVEGSVLWLIEDNAKASSNLRKEAVLRGIDAARLIFAKRMELSEHLARHRLADLFLDTRPCNAHTTASDALWTGLPVLTCIGENFAGRVAASLLNAIHLPELITSTPEAYEALAIELAMNPDGLMKIKRKLASNRLATPLFNTQLFTRHIEAAYTAMYERYHAGLAPEHIHVQA